LISQQGLKPPTSYVLYGKYTSILLIKWKCGKGFRGLLTVVSAYHWPRFYVY